MERGRHHLADLRPPDIGLLGYTLNHMGIDYNYVSNEFDAWAPSS
jgi:hypothetical protein